MDPKYRRRLQQLHEAIIKDFDLSDIQDRLYERGYFSNEEYEWAIASSKTNRADRTRDFLASLMNYGNNAKFDIFVESLEKPYFWLWEDLKKDTTVADLSKSFEDNLSRGDVPRPPDHYVKRATLEAVVASKLKLLTRHQILALHGMSGSGKTCVAIGALRNNPELVADNFSGTVFWLNLGNCKTEDDIIAQQMKFNIGHLKIVSILDANMNPMCGRGIKVLLKLFRKTSSVYTRNSFMILSTSMSSIGSAGDSSLNLDASTDDLRDKLKMQFLETPLKDALLVLDEVNDKTCLDAFDIGCKILITTRDTGVVANYKTQIITVENNFQKAESLELFASYLDEPVSRLPRQAKKLHELCKGSPFHIALIGAQLAENRERLRDDTRLWDQYVKKLEKKEYSFFLTRPSDNPMKPIEMCINALNDNVRTLYIKLAILPDNVKVTANVLAKLWNKREEEVNSIMQQLKDKSLIIANYDREVRNYIYEVHDLIMNYLRTCLTNEEKIKLHVSLLNNYNYTRDNAPVEIIDDGYIAYYVGYHILHTQNENQKWSLFKKLFLDLKFLGNKVRLTGPADVILDLQKYEKYIVTEELDRDLIHSIKAYLMTHGTDLHRYQCTDIIQSILQHQSTGILFTNAYQIARNNCTRNELYFEFLHEQDVDGIKHSTIDVKEEITCVCFLGDYVLVGTRTGVVKFFHNPTNKLNKEYIDVDASQGHPVKWIGVAVSRTYPIVSVLYYNGTLKLWNIDDIDTASDSEDIIEEEPEEVQNNNMPCNVTITPDPRLGAIRNCRWSVNETYIITHSDHYIVLYSPNGDIKNVINAADSDTFLVCCVPCNNDRYLATATLGTSQGVNVYDLNTKNCVMTFGGDIEMDKVQDILSLPGSNKILTLSTIDITQHSFHINKGNTTVESKTIISSQNVKTQMLFLSFAVNKTGTLLFVSTDDSRVLCVDLKTHTNVFELDNKRGNVVAIAVDEIIIWDEFIPGYDVLLTGTGTVENAVKVWHLDTSYISQATNKTGKVRLTTKFDVSFLNTASPLTPTSPFTGGKELSSTPKRHQSFNERSVSKKLLQNTMSLDRQALKPLNLKGSCNNNDVGMQPLLAVIDDRNNIQVMRGRKILTEISENIKDLITTVKISPCNQHIVYGQKSGMVKKYTLRSKDTVTIMHVNSPVLYMRFVNPNLLIVSGENKSLMAHKLMDVGDWETLMLHKGNSFLGSQELLNDLQGVKRKHSDSISISESRGSLDSHRTFTNGDRKTNLTKCGNLVECFWLPAVGVMTVEDNASVKLWDREMKLSSVLHARRDDVYITCAVLKKNVLVMCDSANRAFETFVLDTESSPVKLNSTYEQKLNKVVTCCDLTSDGVLLALGLDSGDVLIWNVKGRRQVKGMLRHHKHKVQYCAFSPVPDRFYRSSHNTPYLSPTSVADDQPPLVLVTMATEVLWWNITLFVKSGNGKGGRASVTVNALTPLGSPMDTRVEPPAFTNGGATCAGSSQNFFFSEGFLNLNCWKDLWNGKTYKQGSKRKEILACIKLSGIHASYLRHDDRFSCFVTVDNTGHPHIMNVLRDEGS